MPDVKFQPGQIVATPGALEALSRTGTNPDVLLRKHLTGDWGVVDSEDQEANDFALEDGGRLLSAYLLDDSTKVWIITEAVNDGGHRQSTCILLPDEY
jgi:hypothetical protein